VRRDELRRYAAPAAFLLVATVAIVLIRSGIESGHDQRPAKSASVPLPPHRKVITTTTKRTTTAGTTTTAEEFWTVQAGDTFGVISTKTGVPVATIEKLNPDASSTTLHIGQKIRIR
jgi:LysM repeat protein